MQRFAFNMAVVLALIGVCGENLPTATAGRTAGPTSAMIVVPANQTVYFDETFNAGQPAIVSITTTGRTPVQVNLYDADGNIALGNGFGARISARMDVYRAGLFRIEVVNMGDQDAIILLATN